MTERTNAQTELILNHLRNVGPITPIDALRRYECFRLAARISDLRSAGHNIETQIVEADGKRFAEYRMAG